MPNKDAQQQAIEASLITASAEAVTTETSADGIPVVPADGATTPAGSVTPVKAETSKAKKKEESATPAPNMNKPNFVYVVSTYTWICSWFSFNG